MENHNGHNGHHNVRAIVKTSPHTHPPPGTPRLERAFMIASEVIQMEAKLNAKMTELNSLVVEIDETQMSGFLLAMMRQPNISTSILATLPIPALPEGTPSVQIPGPPKLPTLASDLKERIMALMDDGRERKSATIIKSLKATKQKSSVYFALTELVKEGRLVRPAYAFYLMRGGNA